VWIMSRFRVCKRIRHVILRPPVPGGRSHGPEW
jgi:hypothetical protein